jgi:aminotransferase
VRFLFCGVRGYTVVVCVTSKKHKRQSRKMAAFDNSMLIPYPPMGVYNILQKFHKVTGKYMGSEGTHPWVQGSPLEGPVPGGPDLPTTVQFSYSDLKYPNGAGESILVDAIVRYYKHFYGAKIEADNVFIFAGGKSGIVGCMSFVKPDANIVVEEVEYSQYWDALNVLNKKYTVVPSNETNGYRPTFDDYLSAASAASGDVFIMKSNPSNPTGVMWSGDRLKQMVEYCSQDGHGGLFDEAYEFFHDPAESALKYIDDINHTNILVLNSSTKGLQAPGARVAWVIASRAHIHLFRNYSSVTMGGVSRLSQIYVSNLLDIERVTQARHAVNEFYGIQRKRYADAFVSLGCTVYGADGCFYIWCKLPHDLTAAVFNERLFAEHGAILPGELCDMMRREDASPHATYIRFSFGPLRPESFDEDIAVLRKCLTPTL